MSTRRRSGWTDASPAAYGAGLQVARGCYQRAILAGRHAISGSDLRGRALRWKFLYRVSLGNLIHRLRARGVVVSERRGARGARILVLRTREEVTP